MISIERHEAIAVLTLAGSEKNPIDLELVGKLASALSELREDPDTLGLVLASSSKTFFSIGFDIPGLFDVSREDFGIFYKAFNEFCLDLYTFPKPTAAAVQGHATAGGFILTLACDDRILSEGKYLMGLNEAKLGVPAPYFSELVLEQIAGRANAGKHIEEGEFFMPDEALEMGIADHLIPNDEVLPAAIKAVSGVDAAILSTYSSIKKARTKKIKKAVRKTLDEKTKVFLARWYTPDTRALLRETMKKY
ncbi:MAG: enoyl-CoA hydratase/isomerase family protein [Bacteroidales bacterium]|nr:enoyl-CoA hydratase/isomerase family protein [Candidatus Latescibacterota bacterium]